MPIFVRTNFRHLVQAAKDKKADSLPGFGIALAFVRPEGRLMLGILTSLHPFRFCCHTVRIDLPDRCRHRQSSIACDREFLAELAGVLVDRLGHDVAGRPAGRFGDKVACTGSDPRRAD